MHRRFSSLVRNSASGSSAIAEEASINDDNESKFSKTTAVANENVSPPALKVKRVDYYYSRWTRSYKYRVSRLLICAPECLLIIYSS